MGARVLTKVQEGELLEAERVAMAEMKKRAPSYASTIAAAAVSGRIGGVLDALFVELNKAGEKMPEQFTLSISHSVPAEVDAAATAYLAADSARSRAAWAFTAKKRALKREFRDLMDQRAWIALLQLRRAQLYRGQSLTG